MANKYQWFKHLGNARNDDFIRRLGDRFGHFGYAGYFKLLEVLHEHGNGDFLKITPSRLSQELGSRWPQVRLLLDFCRTSGKVEFNLSQTEVELIIKKFKQIQKNLHSNGVASVYQKSANGVSRVEESRVEPYSPFFDQFWKAYPRKIAKAVALKAWDKLGPGGDLVATIMSALENHKKNADWQNNGGKFIPHPATWLNQKRWEDEIESHGSINPDLIASS